MPKTSNSLAKSYKVLFLGNFWKAWDGSVCFENYIKDSFETLGHIVYPIQREKWREEVKKVDKVDFILISQWEGYGDIKELRKFKAPIIYWAFDYHWQTLADWHINLAKEADLFLSKELEHKDFYEKKGVNFHWFLEDFAPDFYDRRFPSPTYDVVFTGSYLDWAKERTELIKAIDKKFNLEVYTFTVDQWEKQGVNVHSFAHDDELAEIVAKSKINIAIDHVNSAGYWSDRVARIMALGGFVLNRYVPQQELIFKDYIEYFKDTDECLEKIAYYLKHDNKRERFAERGYKYAQENLKCINRIKELIIIYEKVL